LEHYTIELLSKAYHDLDDIYDYIAQSLLEPEVAEKLINALEEAIFSLEQMPRRGTLRKIGVYANKGYRQLFVKNFIVIYRINEKQKQVIIVTIKYFKSNF